MHSETDWRSRRDQLGVTVRAVAQSMVEYAIVAALVALVAFVAVKALGSTVSSTFGHVCSQVEAADQASSNGGGGSGGNCNTNGG
jgi:Flp pilus assembly pilin Flp